MLTAFLPCRSGSERVPQKNIKRFSSFENGLIEIKLNQLLNCSAIDNVVLSTNDDLILEYANGVNSSKLTIHERAEYLCTSTTSTDELVGHALELIPEGDILWTHVTSPFINSKIYSEIIEQYRNALSGGFDSLMTTSKIFGFLWNENEPINYDREREKWPRTQTLPVIHEVNSGVFLSTAGNYRKLNDRIGVKPFLYSLDKFRSFDIDWEDDFELAQLIYEKGLVTL